jgi:cell division protein FtsQ
VWDNPRLLNAVADFLIVAAAALALFAGLQLLLRSPLFPLRDVIVSGQGRFTTRAEIESAVADLSGNFFAVDLTSVRARLERLPWVRRVDVRRVWPDKLEVALEEHVAFARWGEAELVNTFGERFAAQTDARLPLFAGPADTAAEVTRRYRRFAEILAPLGAAPERVILSPRFAWQLRLADGLTLELGRDAANDAVEARLERFVAAFPRTLGKIQQRHEYVDLRYPNGFALRVPGLKG